MTPVLVLRVLLAAVLLNAGIGKYAGDPGPVDTFDQVGLGQWFRYFIATIETVSAVGLLIAPIAGLAALAAASVLAGAVTMEAFVLTDGNPIMPAVVLALLTVVAWHHRGSPVMRRLSGRAEALGADGRRSDAGAEQDVARGVDEAV